MSLSIAVTLTWAFFTSLFILTGLWCTLLSPTASWQSRIRIAMWLGLAQVTALLILINFFAPLKSAVTIWLLVALAGASLAAWLIKRGWRTRATTARASMPYWWTLIPIATLAITVLLLAHFFAGPLANYDSGLYHINAIQYSAEYPTIPGLANLHSRLGTNTTSSLFPAMLAATPWGIEAFRLLVGLFIFLFVIDLSLRLLELRRSPRSPGTILMLLAATAAIPFLLGTPAMLVTSPTPDTISMILVVVAAAYLLDAFWNRNVLWGVIATVVAVLAASVRTQLWVFAALVVVVLIAHAWRSPNSKKNFREHRALLAVGAALSALIAIGMLVRDYLLSGWLFYPATIFPMPVDWRVPDPSGSRDWILSWAREPGGSPEVVLNSWSWFSSWLARTATDWAVQLVVGSLLAAVIIWALIASSTNNKDNKNLQARIGIKGLALLSLPALASIAIWFFTAPDPRFAWGPLLILGLIPLSLALARLSLQFTQRPHAVTVSALVAAFMTLAIAGPAASTALNTKGYVADGYELREFSFGPLSFVAHINPVESATIVEFALNDGNMILTPHPDDRCHLSFPACRPYPDPTMQFRGESVRDGFRDGASTSN